MFSKITPATTKIQHLNDSGYKCDGVEVDKEANLESQKKSIKVFNSLSEVKKLYPTVISLNVLEHIEDPSLILSEITRVLKKGGTLLIGVPGVLGFRTAPDHEVYYSKEVLEETFLNLGYEVHKIFSMPIECAWLDSRMEQYCYYGVFKKG